MANKTVSYEQFREDILGAIAAEGRVGKTTPPPLPKAATNSNAPAQSVACGHPDVCTCGNCRPVES